MDAVAYTTDTDTMRMPRTGCVPKVASTPHTEYPKTPESELMSVEEYFGILRKRVNDYYDSLQS